MIPEIEETPEEIHRVDDLTNDITIEPPANEILQSSSNHEAESLESQSNVTEELEEDTQQEVKTEPLRVENPELQVQKVPERAVDRQIPNRTQKRERPSQRARLRQQRVKPTLKIPELELPDIPVLEVPEISQTEPVQENLTITEEDTVVADVQLQSSDVLEQSLESIAELNIQPPFQETADTNEALDFWNEDIVEPLAE